MDFLIEHKWIGELVATGVMIAALFLVRVFLVRLVRSGPEILTDDQRRWTVRIKNATWIALFIALFFIWAPELQTLALSITAFALAVVIATKELLTCLLGGLMRAGGQTFKVGDWLAVDGITGEVIDIDAIGLRLQEVDVAGKTYQFTGQTHYVLNSRLLTSNYANVTFLKSFVIHDVHVSIQHSTIDPEVLMGHFKEITEKHVAPHLEEATAFNQEFERRTGLDLHDADPQYFLKSKDFAHHVYTARLLLPTKLAAKIESDITREFLSLAQREGFAAAAVVA